MITKHAFQTSFGDITSLVMDDSEFYELCDEIQSRLAVQNFSNDKTKLSSDQIRSLRDNGHIPLIRRGLITQFIFDKYDVQTEFLSAIIRGNGMAVFARAFSQGQA